MEIFFYSKVVEARTNKKKDEIEEHSSGRGEKKIQRKLHKPRLKYPSIILI